MKTIKLVVKHNLSRGAKFNRSVVSSLLHRIIQPTDRDTSHAISFQSDVQLLTTQQKMLQSLDDDNIRHFVDSLLPSSDPNFDLKQRASVSDLIETCKSRYCQSLDDLKTWNDYLSAKSSYISEKIKSERSEKIKSVTLTSSTSSDNNNNSNSD